MKYLYAAWTSLALALAVPLLAPLAHPAEPIKPVVRVSAFAEADPPVAASITLPPTVSGDVGDFVTVPAKTDGKIVKWVSLDPQLKLFPIDLLKDTKTAVCIGKVPGSFKLLAYTAAGDVPSDPAVCVVVIGGVVPPPPDPGPPSPTDPFAKALQAAYMADTDSDKAKSAASLAALYRAAASLSGSSKFTTPAGVMAWIKGSEDIAATAIPGTRKAIGAELNKVLPAVDATPLTDATRALLAKHFTRVAMALEGVR